jgi:hypothetical protein
MGRLIFAGWATPQGYQCPACGGTEEHDEACELITLSIRRAHKLGLDRARAEVSRQAEQAEIERQSND